MRSTSQIQQIKQDIEKEQYGLEKVIERERNSSRKKNIKRLLRKVKEAREESMKDRMLLLLEFGKEIGEDNIKNENRYDIITAQKLYKSFENRCLIIRSGN